MLKSLSRCCNYKKSYSAVTLQSTSVQASVIMFLALFSRVSLLSIHHVYHFSHSSWFVLILFIFVIFIFVIVFRFLIFFDHVHLLPIIITLPDQTRRKRAHVQVLQLGGGAGLRLHENQTPGKTGQAG